MEIVFDCERMKYPNTGLFEYCQQLGLSLLNTKDDNDKLDLYLQKSDQQYFTSELKFINHTRLHKFIFPKLDNEIDIWHTCHQASKYIPVNKKFKRVITVHDLNFLYENKSKSKRATYLKTHQRNIELADHIIAISEFTKNDIIKHLDVNVPITVIYNGCNVETFPGFNQPKYHPLKPFLFSLGTVNAKKNFHILPALLKDTEMELIIAGNIDKGYINRIIDEAKKNAVNDRVKIIGPINNKDKYWYYKNCKAFLFPSIAEGFGLPVIEAMHFGKPVFLSTATSLPEIGGKYAFYFENFNPESMIAIFNEGIKNYELKGLSKAITNHARQFTWGSSALAYWKVYKSLL